MGLRVMYRSSPVLIPSRISAACLLWGTRGSPNAPDKIASYSVDSISSAPAGRLTFVARYFSAPQSKRVRARSRLKICAASSIVSTACSMTSGPMPSPGMTAMRFKDLTSRLVGDSGSRAGPEGVKAPKQIWERRDHDFAHCLDALAAYLVERVLRRVPV